MVGMVRVLERISPMSALGRRVKAVVAFAAFLVAPLAHAVEIHVSPAGSDSGGDGSAERPFLTVEKAVEALAGQAEGVVALAAGTYRSPQYTFPITLDLNRSLALRGPAGGQAVLEGSRETQILKINVASGDPWPEIRLEGLQVKGGLTGLSVVGARLARFGVKVLGSRFSGQRYQGAELVAGEQG